MNQNLLFSFSPLVVMGWKTATEQPQIINTNELNNKTQKTTATSGTGSHFIGPVNGLVTGDQSGDQSEIQSGDQSVDQS